MGSDLLALLAAVALLGANAFFVGAEFALISARRDRLEAMAAAGTPGARVVLRAGADLSRMLAASQLGITISSLLLGRLGEPAVAHLLERPLQWAGMPEAALQPLAFAVSLAVVVVAHIVLGEMVPKNIAIAGPERTAIWLVPPFLVFTTIARPLITLFNLMANGVLRLIGVEPRDELESAFTSGELADLIAESGREGLLDDDESRRLTRALSSAEAVVADVLVPVDELVTLPVDPSVGDVAKAVADTGSYSAPGHEGTAAASVASCWHWPARSAARWSRGDVLRSWRRFGDRIAASAPSTCPSTSTKDWLSAGSAASMVPFAPVKSCSSTCKALSARPMASSPPCAGARPTDASCVRPCCTPAMTRAR
jgi:hypothetical protein